MNITDVIYMELAEFEPPVGTEDEDVRYYAKVLYFYRCGIQDMQRHLREREEELRTELG